MKVKKIDIKTELMDMPDNKTTMDFSIGKDLDYFFSVEQHSIVNRDLDIDRKIYEVVKISNPYRNYQEQLLIPINDRGFFDELITIPETIVEEKTEKERKRLKEKEENLREEFELKYQLKIKKEADKAYDVGIEQGRSGEKYRIKHLSWYKRLFNKF